MIRSLPPSQPKPFQRSAPSRAEIEEASKSDPLFDLTTLDNGREIYFLPQMDRLAAHLATQAQQPLQVRLEAENQFIEYTITPDPTAPIHASINGTDFDIVSGIDQAGEQILKGTSAAGDFDGNYYVNPQGTQVTGKAGPNVMPVNHSLDVVANPAPGDPVLEGGGSFACARMSTDYYPEGDNLHLMGRMGVHNIDALLSPAENGWVLQGEFGDIRFKQTFTKV